MADAPADARRTPDVALVDVSCSSDVACTAVGAYATVVNGRVVRRPLLETWAGGTWTPTALGLPPGVRPTESADLRGVACASGRCLAQGAYFGKGANQPYSGLLAEVRY